MLSSFQSSDSWVILSPIEASIKAKIESVGTPLRDWDIKINRGVLTGLNEAFIISTEKRDEILSNCKDEDERRRTAELIRPILRGKDIRRYSCKWANLWLVYIPWHFPLQKDDSIQGASHSAEKEFLRQYSSVYSYLLTYKDALEARNKAETGIRYEWYALQRWGSNYWDDFNKQKIVWGNLNLKASYTIAPAGMFISAPSNMIVPASEFLLAVLNSKLADFYIRNLGVTRNGGYFEYKPMFVEQLPVPRKNEKNECYEDIFFNAKTSFTDIDAFVYSIYGLDENEILFIEKQEK